MNNNPQNYLDRLKEISGKKHILLQDMYILTQAQTEAVNIEDVEKLDELIANKQLKIDEISKLDEEFGVYFRRLKQNLGVDSMEEVKGTEMEGIREFKSTINNIMKLMKEISEMENDNNMKAKKLLSSIGDEIRKINTGKKASSIYNSAPNMGSSSYFIDKKK